MSASAIVQILFAGIVSSVIGFVWYHPKVFGTVWMRHSGITPEAVEQGKKKMHQHALLALLASMIAAYVLYVLLSKLGIFDIRGAVLLGFWSWAGFVAPALSGIILWEQKPLALYLINAGYWLVSLIAVSVILVY